MRERSPVPRLERGTGRASIVWAQRGHMPGSLHSVCVCVCVCVCVRGGVGGVAKKSPPFSQTPGALLSALSLGVGFSEKKGRGEQL